MEKQKVLVWDVPTRVFHWLLAASFAGAFLTSESERYRNIHVTLGYTLAGLIVFRLVWGIVGTRYARFSSFMFGPRRVVDYLKSLFAGPPQHYVGHNPAGSWMIYLVLAAALLVGATGYAIDNETSSDALSRLHEFVANTMLCLVVFHIGGVVVSSLAHGENLAKSMLSGRKRAAAGEGIARAHWIVAVALFLAVAGFWSGGGEFAPGAFSKLTSTATIHREHHLTRRDND